MISIKTVFLAFFGFCAGGIVAAGVYAFLAIIGVFVRLMGKTGTRKKVLLYETVIVAGGIGGNLMDLYGLRLPLGEWPGTMFLGLGGLSVGVFVGCLVMSLAETLKALPVISRRIHLAVGFQYLVIAIAAGKLAGSLLYFWEGMPA